MRLTKMAMLAFCVLAAAAMPQQAPAADKPAKAILEMIPAGTMGFVVVNDVQGSTSAVDKFMERIGQAKALNTETYKGCLEFLRVQAKLGEGFNSQGGFAAVMLDPQQFNVTIEKLTKGDESGQPVKLPAVLMVPGSSIESVFTQYERSTPEVRSTCG